MKIPFLFRQRWFFSLLGVIALSLLIWFLGPLLTFGGHEPLGPPGVRLICISILLGLWLLWWGWRWWQALRRNRELAAGMAGVSEEERAAAEEEEILEERFQEVSKCCSVRGSRGKNCISCPGM